MSATDSPAEIPALLPEVPPGEHHQCKKFSNQRSQPARREDAVLTTPPRGHALRFLEKRFIKGGTFK